MKLAHTIRQLRLERKMTLKETDKQLSVPELTYRDREYGRTMLAEHSLLKDYI